MSAAAPRRDVLLGLVGPAMVAPFAAAGVGERKVQGAEIVHPAGDAELLDLWRQYLALMVEGSDRFDEDYEPFGDAMTALERRAEGMTATTLAGVGVLLRLGIMRSGFDDPMNDRYVDGERSDRPPIGLEPLLWRALVSVEREEMS